MIDAADVTWNSASGSNAKMIWLDDPMLYADYVCQWQRHPKDKHPVTSAQWAWINAPDTATGYGPYEYLSRAWEILGSKGWQNAMRYYTT